MLLVNFVTTVGLLYTGVVFFYAGIHKLRDLDGAQIAILDYQLVPAQLARPLAVVFGATEVLAGGLLALGCSGAVPLGLLILGVVSAAAGSALIRGLDIDCHCFRSGERLSWTMLGRNGVFATVLLGSLVLRPPWSSEAFSPQLVIAPMSYLLAVGLAVTAAVVIASTIRLFRWSITTRGGNA